MIVCPNCEHINPDEATQCEACYTPLPRMSSCPSCGATIQTDATFCGQCGYNLQPNSAPMVAAEAESEPEPEPVPPVPTATGASIAPPPVAPPPVPAATRLQMEMASLQHLQTDSKIELPLHLSVIHIGKPNARIPPDIDVSGFPDSDIVSRVHADIRVEGGIYYLEDSGSANGTYVNHTPLPPGNRHRLRAGDRISLGKGDKMTFIFQMS
ncbi:FHA domain-containing protein [Microcystis aeruginosa]|uniref:FHA domain-containing protein n=1 Tax=Microcystis aeruginosa TaxID=1126 RepID=UPI0012314455|nr:FHA domain-containing protein [Microcystis aeruginosa]GCA90965.1 glycogen accumulation regulator GarA [Microcystis aeruginosa NIES-4264]